MKIFKEPTNRVDINDEKMQVSDVNEDELLKQVGIIFLSI